jgi:hypothetical protein
MYTNLNKMIGYLNTGNITMVIVTKIRRNGNE